jgi:hypothetical protein
MDRASSSHVGPITVGVFLKEEKVEQEEFGGPQNPQVVRSLTRRWRKANPDAYSTNRLNNVSCFTLNACDVLSTTCRVLFDDSDRLHGNTLSHGHIHNTSWLS